MKPVLSFIFSILTYLSCFAQPNPEPFIIKGQLDNCPEDKLLIYFENEPGLTEVDTIFVQPNGSFYFETTAVTKPHKTGFKRNNVQFYDLYVAPGYQLTITADVKDVPTLVKTKKITGKGQESNAYQLRLHELIKEQGLDTIQLYTLPTEEFLQYIDKGIALQEKVRRVVFSQKVPEDPYFEYFNEVTRLDNLFHRLSFLLAHINMGKVPLKEAETFLAEHFDQDILANLFEDQWLISNIYKDFVHPDYLRLMRKLDIERDATIKEHKDYSFRKVSTLYSGKLRDFALCRMAHLRFMGCKSIQQLNERRELFQPYLDKIESPAYQDYLNRKLAQISAKLGKIEIGGPAPEFELEDEKGNLYKLSDFRGKVVYIDLWASWCGPCRKETPYLNELIHSYQRDDRIAFVSIAVLDDYSDWRKALAADQPLSLQLYDADRFVYSTYTLGTIPQFVLIDREGKIVDIYAPRPSEGEVLVKVLEEVLMEK